MVKLNIIFLLSLLVLLLIGVSYATEANNDTVTTTDTFEEVVKETSSTTNNIDNIINEETKKDKEITKQTNTNKTTKTASKTYDVADYDTLHNVLTADTYNTVTLNVNSDIKLLGNTALNNAITSLTINGNGKTVNGDNKYHFLKIESSSVNISNLKITNCNGEYGGAIENHGTLNITTTTFNNNTATRSGGAINNYNDGYLSIYNSTFNNNIATWNGGAINGECFIYNSTFNNNNATWNGGAIYNYGNLTIYNSTLYNNTANDGGATYNYGNLTIDNSTLYNNTANNSGAIYNYDGNLIIYNCTFNKNIASDNYTQDIYNYGRLISIKPYFSSTEKTILNRGIIQIHNESKIEENIYNDGGRIFLLDKLNKNEKNFTYLDQLIHSGQKEIQIKEDIILEEGEEEKFIYGITIDEDDIIIDGNGHTINAKGDNIFNIIGNNITIKNIKIVNGYGDNGGAIFNTDGTLTITNTSFNNNTVRYSGGAIDNSYTGILTVYNSTFNNNKASEGGAISSSGNLTIYNSTFNNNTANNGGAINNRETLTITCSTFTKNKANDGGAVYNYDYGDLIIQDSTFNNNTAINQGGAIENDEANLNVINTTFNNNSADCGGAIHNYYYGTEISITNNTFTYNIAVSGGAIYNSLTYELDINHNIFKCNKATSGAAIYDSHSTTTIYAYSSNGSPLGPTEMNYGSNDFITGNLFIKNEAESGESTIETNQYARIDRKNNINEETSSYYSTIYVYNTNKTTKVDAWIYDNTFDDEKINTTLTINKIPNTKYNNNITIKGKLFTENNNLIKGATITVKLNEDSHTVKTDNNGVFTLTVLAKTVGTNNVTVTYEGNKEYSESINYTTFIVKQPTLIKYANMANVETGTTVKIVGRLISNVTGQAVKYASVTVKVNDETYKLKTNGAGYLSMNYTVNDYNVQNITFKYNGNSLNLASSNSTTFKVKQPTWIKVAYMSNVEYGSTVKILGRLLNGSTAVKYKYVNVTVNNKVYKVKTDGAGYIRLNYTVNNYNDQKITFKFAGNSLYAASSNSTTFKVKQPTWIKHASIGKVKQKSTVKIVGRVLYNGTNSVKYVPVNVTVNGKVYKLKTDGAGYYRLNYTATTLGTVTFTSNFAGNKLYLASTNSTKFTVVKS